MIGHASTRVMALCAALSSATSVNAQILPREPINTSPTIYAGAPPANFRVASTTPVSANLAWDVTPGAMTYTLMRTVGVGQQWTTLTPTPLPAATLNYTDAGGIDYRTTYTYRLQVNYTGSPPGYTDLSVPLAKPVNPSGVKATQSGEGVVQLSWNAVSGAPAYTVFGPGITGGAVTVTRNSASAGGLPLGTHNWTVASVYQPGNITTPAAEFPAASATVEKWAGSYRVYLIGFTNQSATTDEPKDADGVGDEIFPMVYWQRFTDPATPRLSDQNWARGSVHGDNGKNARSRVRAGSGQPTGGILSNDIVPGGFIGANYGSSSSTMTATSTSMKGNVAATTFPITVWEGQLVRNNDVLILYPSLWEGDEHPEIYRAVYEQGIAGRTADAINLPNIRTALDQNGISELTGALAFQTPSRGVNFPADRPIGFQAVPGRVGGSDAGFFDRMIVLSMRKIEEELAKPPKYTGLPAGTIGLSFFEPGRIWEAPDAYNFSGRYVLYLVVERR